MTKSATRSTTNRFTAAFLVAVLATQMFLMVPNPAIEEVEAYAPADPQSPFFGIPGVPEFHNYARPPPPPHPVTNGRDLTVGVDAASGRALLQAAGGSMYRLIFDDTQNPPTATWEFPPPAPPGPFLNQGMFLYSENSIAPALPPRHFVMGNDLSTPGCGTAAYSDNQGGAWTASTSCTLPSMNGLSVAAGPFTFYSLQGAFASGNPWPAPPAEPYAVYACAQLADITCWGSFDGGDSWQSLDLPTDLFGPCEGLLGHIAVSPTTGALAVPVSACNGVTTVFVSPDGGFIWDASPFTTYPVTGSGSFAPDAAYGVDGSLYVTQAEEDGIYIAVSHDDGATWENDLGVKHGFTDQDYLDVSQFTEKPLGQVEFATVVVGDSDRAAVSFLGSTSVQPKAGCEGTLSDGHVWHLYTAITMDAGKSWEVLRITKDPIQRGGISTGGTCGNLGSYIESAMGPTGRVHISYTDGCTGTCAGPGGWAGQSRDAWPNLARQTTGRGLLSAFDGELAPGTELAVPTDICGDIQNPVVTIDTPKHKGVVQEWNLETALPVAGQVNRNWQVTEIVAEAGSGPPPGLIYIGTVGQPIDLLGFAMCGSGFGNPGTYSCEWTPLTGDMTFTDGTGPNDCAPTVIFDKASELDAAGNPIAYQVEFTVVDLGPGAGGQMDKDIALIQVDPAPVIDLPDGCPPRDGVIIDLDSFTDALPAGSANAMSELLCFGADHVLDPTVPIDQFEFQLDVDDIFGAPGGAAQQYWIVFTPNFGPRAGKTQVIELMSAGGPPTACWKTFQSTLQNMGDFRDTFLQLDCDTNLVPTVTMDGPGYTPGTNVIVVSFPTDWLGDPVSGNKLDDLMAWSWYNQGTPEAPNYIDQDFAPDCKTATIYWLEPGDLELQKNCKQTGEAGGEMEGLVPVESPVTLQWAGPGEMEAPDAEGDAEGNWQAMDILGVYVRNELPMPGPSTVEFVMRVKSLSDVMSTFYVGGNQVTMRFSIEFCLENTNFAVGDGCYIITTARGQTVNPNQPAPATCIGGTVCPTHFATYWKRLDGKPPCGYFAPEPILGVTFDFIHDEVVFLVHRGGFDFFDSATLAPPAPTVVVAQPAWEYGCVRETSGLFVVNHGMVDPLLFPAPIEPTVLTCIGGWTSLTVGVGGTELFAPNGIFPVIVNVYDTKPVTTGIAPVDALIPPTLRHGVDEDTGFRYDLRLDEIPTPCSTSKPYFFGSSFDVCAIEYTGPTGWVADSAMPLSFEIDNDLDGDLDEDCVEPLVECQWSIQDPAGEVQVVNAQSCDNAQAVFNPENCLPDGNFAPTSYQVVITVWDSSAPAQTATATDSVTVVCDGEISANEFVRIIVDGIERLEVPVKTMTEEGVDDYAGNVFTEAMFKIAPYPYALNGQHTLRVEWYEFGGATLLAEKEIVFTIALAKGVFAADEEVEVIVPLDSVAKPGDKDGDGIIDALDNCPFVPNPDQANMDGDLYGDVCDTDRDGDGWENYLDNCPDDSDPLRADNDHDWVQGVIDPNAGGDVCDQDDDNDGVPDLTKNGKADLDNCRFVPNPAQTDSDGDGKGDACDMDRDNDGCDDYMDAFPDDPAECLDSDGDGIGDNQDPSDQVQKVRDSSGVAGFAAPPTKSWSIGLAGWIALSLGLLGLVGIIVVLVLRRGS